MALASMHPFDHAFLATMQSFEGARWDCVAAFRIEGPAPSLQELRAQVDVGRRAMPCLDRRLRLPRRVRDQDAHRNAYPDTHPDTHPASTRVTGQEPVERVEDVVTAAPADMHRALDAALDSSPLPDGVPWRLWRVTSPASDHWIAAYQWHHGFQDGLAGLRAALVLLGLRDPGLPGRRLPKTPWHAYALGALTFAGKCAADLVRARVHGPAANVPLAGVAGPARTFEVPLGRLGAIAAAQGGTVNDVYVAVTGSALAAWAAREDIELTHLPLLVPVDVRRHDEEQAHGNRLFYLRTALPHGKDVTAAHRLRSVIEASGQARRRHWRRIAQDFLHVTPRKLALKLVPLFVAPGFTAAVVSIVPLPTDGDAATVSRLTGRGVLVPGHLMYAVMGICGDQAEASFLFDRALPGTERFPALWLEAVEELERPRSRTGSGR